MWDWNGNLVTPLEERNVDAAELRAELFFAVESYMSIQVGQALSDVLYS